MKRVTWKKPDGTWGVNGVDLKKLEQPAVYGAMVTAGRWGYRDVPSGSQCGERSRKA